MHTAHLSLYNDGISGPAGTYYPPLVGSIAVDNASFNPANASDYPSTVTLEYDGMGGITVSPTNISFVLSGLAPGTHGVEVVYGMRLEDPPGDLSATYRGSITIPCCTPTVTPTATPQGPSGYTLVLTLEPGQCVAPLSDIVWTPAPSSGQGTLTAIYTDRRYDTVYSGSVTAIDVNDCDAGEEYKFTLPSGPNKPGCQQ